MAENKNSFILYADLISTVSMLTDEEAGVLLKTILAYVNDLNPVIDNRAINLVFNPIKERMQKDLKKWESTINKKSVSGVIGNIKRWHPDIYILYESGKITLEEANLKVAQSRTLSHTDSNQSQNSQSVANIAVSVSDSVSVSVSDIIINKEKEEEEKKQKALAPPPSYDEFLEFALSKKPLAKKEQIKAKYDSWILQGWKTANGTIKNWKATITNTLPYIDEIKSTETKPFKLAL